MTELEVIVATASKLGAEAPSRQTADVLALAENQDLKIADLESCVKDLELAISAKHLERLMSRTNSRQLTVAEFGVMITELRHRIMDEISSMLLLRSPSEMSRYFDDPGFHPDVYMTFPSAVIEVEEAARCLALGRNTACVLHLMRAVEPVVHALALRLGVRYEYRGWDPIIKKMRSELERSYDDMDPAIKGKKQFFSNALDRLTGMKDSLRNPTMHARINYDAERAHDVYRTVRTFMELCASELNEIDVATSPSA